MRTLLQRVLKGRVLIDGEVINEINKGYVILLGISETDTDRQVNLIAEKTANLRIMPDSDGKMNLSILQTGGEILVVSQFTLYADLSAGRRPSFLKSGNPQRAEKLYELFIEKLKKAGIKKVVSGKFGAYMTVEIVNDGPVTILIDSDEFLK
ncbi:D-tyrosyl-tRNA(Tyr) deacylase [Candidatus Gottesmanbacteria bacterium RIFCSPHIGHO2_02_FULL_40_24]|uniref:D-aminoacyl-tRNA deacylase n=1 Tax=Candidatus Gottesmanbacteria bacterium RIFCSPHIGHO2_01_FULL_40_15 TaxID=1798376 RepID=A0A1F5Z7P3_9BACT|nr:MAG: D-tyrosyl-tRNA(Tyr) deacylase [Candidatus Gottesmanbacteria bacterium RIFCSPHIGHO2_01_FULL_40_15]OGG16474.1 MAG: D-tyrosyl-tRNA(Tyr) deacylase [Candidatus Gottesmanbacteria bacterium RIFCSPHIGHO2_02_FULL_40_24]OGG22754.1 MAG: D-tyrosyl-tRNA(Tyr) deacylase [Candidatus Gottesmanbacteria bacterium RIFCSPLOWO2_01_FULL_40_10]OGG25587.1 MAG: D-tyrosyl-tRNA(Tyr) deacylase [Candidatus Gottesmanbacteria bacterium RIFCSPHIGHO2_12_FULL_40_13]OGG32592.1 MAG: D-tyrosyl-tRNA(Tyr) deacylase [Candidatu